MTPNEAWGTAYHIIDQCGLVDKTIALATLSFYDGLLEATNVLGYHRILNAIERGTERELMRVRREFINEWQISSFEEGRAA